MPHQRTQKTQLKECIDQCRKCTDTCLETLSYCLNEGSSHAEKKHVVLLQVCSEICETSTHAMLLELEQHQTICRACAEICEACAESCESFHDDETMKTCAETCRNCAESCYEMAGVTIGTKKSNRKSSPSQTASM